MSLIIIISNYPLSIDYRKGLEDLEKGTFQYLTLNELQKLPINKVFFKLRSLNANKLYLAFEDENSYALLSVLSLLSAIANTKQTLIISPTLLITPTYRIKSLLSVFSLLSASLVGYFHHFKITREVKYLSKEALLDIKKIEINKNSELLYLKTNMWLGVKVGGSIGHVSGVVNALVDKLFKVNYASAEMPVMLSNDVIMVDIKAPTQYGLPKELNFFTFNNSFYKQIRNYSSGKSFSLIYQRLSLANFVGVKLSRKLNIPLVLEYNGSEVWVSKNWGTQLKYHKSILAIEDVCLKHAHVIVTVSDVSKEELIDRGVDPQKIVVYPNCIDPLIFNPKRFDMGTINNLKKEIGFAKDDKLVTFVGTFGMWHGVPIFAKAIRYLIEKEDEWLVNNKVKFLLVGDGSTMNDVKEILGEFLSSSFVCLTGIVPQKDAPKYLAASDILVSPHIPNADGSRFFGSPTKLFEYMAMGKAIIASDLEQIGEILKNSHHVGELPNKISISIENKLAILTKPSSVDELVDGIKFLINNPEWQNILGKNVREEALSKYTWGHHVDHILESVKKNLS